MLRHLGPQALHAVFDELGRAVVVGQERKIYSANTDRPLRYEAAFLVDPGKYRLRLAAIDLAGNSGSVEREVQAWDTNSQEVSLGDLMLTSTRDTQGGTIRPPVLLKVEDGQLQTFLELYTNKPGSLDQAKVTFEVAEGPDGPTLTADTVPFHNRDDGTAAQSAARLTLGALPPGRYVVRAVITSSDKTVGKLVRPFVLLPNNRPAPAPAASTDVRASSATTSTTMAIPSGDLGLFSTKPSSFRREDVLKPEMLRATLDAMPANRAAASRILSRSSNSLTHHTKFLANAVRRLAI